MLDWDVGPEKISCRELVMTKNMDQGICLPLQGQVILMVIRTSLSQYICVVQSNPWSNIPWSPQLMLSNQHHLHLTIMLTSLILFKNFQYVLPEACETPAKICCWQYIIKFVHLTLSWFKVVRYLFSLNKFCGWKKLILKEFYPYSRLTRLNSD